MLLFYFPLFIKQIILRGNMHFLVLLFVKNRIVKVQSIFSFHCFTAYFTLVDKRTWKMNPFHMVDDIVLLSICLSTQSALKLGTYSRAFFCDIFQQDSVVISCKQKVASKVKEDILFEIHGWNKRKIIYIFFFYIKTLYFYIFA